MYTDGSVDLDRSKSGAESYTQMGESCFGPCNSMLCLDAELLTINAALMHCFQIEAKNICAILLDSKCAIGSLRRTTKLCFLRNSNKNFPRPA